MAEKYKIIYADPPWRFGNKKTGGSMKSGAEAQYPTMSVKELCEMKVEDLTADDCILFMWWVGSMPGEALEVVKAWGFTLKTMTGFNWVKLTKTGKKHFGMGFYTRAGSECCLIAVKGKPKIWNHGIRSVHEAVVEKHSKKPDIFRSEILGLAGGEKRIELFSREKREGWHSWGNEVESDIKIGGQDGKLM